MSGYVGINAARKLPRIELLDQSIKSFAMNGFKLRGIDTPLIRRDLQSLKDGR